MVAYDVMEIVFIQVSEGEIIANLYGAGLWVEFNELDVLVNFTHFDGLRFDAAVGINYTVDAEITVGRSAGITIITTIVPILTPVAGFSCKTLVYPVPDATTLQYRVLFNDIPIILEVSKTVAHGMGIFAQDERTRHFLILRILLNILRRSIHRAIDICIPLQSGTFILDRTAIEHL